MYWKTHGKTREACEYEYGKSSETAHGCHLLTWMCVGTVKIWADKIHPSSNNQIIHFFFIGCGFFYEEKNVTDINSRRRLTMTDVYGLCFNGSAALLMMALVSQWSGWFSLHFQSISIYSSRINQIIPRSTQSPPSLFVVLIGRIGVARRAVKGDQVTESFYTRAQLLLKLYNRFFWSLSTQAQVGVCVCYTHRHNTQRLFGSGWTEFKRR